MERREAAPDLAKPPPQGAGVEARSRPQGTSRGAKDLNREGRPCRGRKQGIARQGAVPGEVPGVEPLVWRAGLPAGEKLLRVDGNPVGIVLQGRKRPFRARGAAERPGEREADKGEMARSESHRENIIETSVPLCDRLRERIAREGPMSFRDFM